MITTLLIIIRAQHRLRYSDVKVKRGQNLEAEVEAKAKAKNNCEKITK